MELQSTCGVGFIQLYFRWINLTDYAFNKIVINAQKIIEVPRSRIKSLNNINFIVMVKRILFRCNIRENQLQEGCILYPSEFQYLIPHFYIAKLGFAGIYLFFLIFAPKHRLWVLVRTASARRFLRVPTIYVLSKSKKKDFY